MSLKRNINIANICIELGHWPSHFKTSTIIIIPKPNKELYNSPKLFRPFILLNTIRKLIEKVIGEHLQFHVILNNFVHLCQLNELKQRLTTDAGVTLTHFIHTD